MDVYITFSRCMPRRFLVYITFSRCIPRRFLACTILKYITLSTATIPRKPASVSGCIRRQQSGKMDVYMLCRDQCSPKMVVYMLCRDQRSPKMDVYTVCQIPQHSWVYPIPQRMPYLSTNPSTPSTATTLWRLILVDGGDIRNSYFSFSSSRCLLTSSAISIASCLRLTRSVGSPAAGGRTAGGYKTLCSISFDTLNSSGSR